MSVLIGQTLVENAKIEKFKCDILRDFQTLCEPPTQDLSKKASKANRFGLILILFWANAKSASEHNYSNVHSRQPCVAVSLDMWVGLFWTRGPYHFQKDES